MSGLLEHLFPKIENYISHNSVPGSRRFRYGAPRPPAPQKMPPMQIDGEVNRAVMDEEERRRRASMNRSMSRMSMPSLQDSLSKTGANKLG